MFRLSQCRVACSLEKLQNVRYLHKSGSVPFSLAHVHSGPIRSTIGHHFSSLRNVTQSFFPKWLQVASQSRSVFWNKNIPRGFGKFFPKGKDGSSGGVKNTTGRTKSATKNEKNTSKSKKTQPEDPWGQLGSSAWVASGLLLFYLLFGRSEDNGQEITWQDFQSKYLAAGQVEGITVVNKAIAVVKLYEQGVLVRVHQVVRKLYFTIGSIENFERKLEYAQRELGLRTIDYVPVTYTQSVNWGSTLLSLAPTLMLLGVTLFMIRGIGSGGGGMGGMAKPSTKTATGVKFKDVAGCDEAKSEIMEFVQFLKKPEKFVRLGAKVPKGALLATAGEASVPFFSMSAREQAPCIIFIDEIDAVARQRSKGGFSGVEMDGFETQEGVVVLADISMVYLNKLKCHGDDNEKYAERLASLTPGFSGADIANICNEAAIFAAREGKEAIEMVDFESAKNMILSPEEKRYPLLKVTIYLPKEIALHSTQALHDRICMALGGRASEEIHFGKVTTGASDDLKRVTQMAHAMVTVYGMSDRVGQVIDEEVKIIIDKMYKRTRQLLVDNKDKVKLLAEELLRKETINEHNIRKMFVESSSFPKRMIWKPRYSTMGLGVEHFSTWKNKQATKSNSSWAPSSDPYIIEEMIQSTEWDKVCFIFLNFEFFFSYQILYLTIFFYEKKNIFLQYMLNGIA
eukprot:GSMAST32.ASY1.ANO1.437.1 assembled CDS